LRAFRLVSEVWAQEPVLVLVLVLVAWPELVPQAVVLEPARYSPAAMPLKEPDPPAQNLTLLRLQVRRQRTPP
jgi:hypothetical protein